MSALFQGNRLNRNILLFHLTSVLIVLTITLFAAFLLMNALQSQTNEGHLKSKLDQNSVQIIQGILLEDKDAIKVLDTMINIDHVQLICLTNNASEQQVLSWPRDKQAQCETFKTSDGLISAHWSSAQSELSIDLYGRDKPGMTFVTIGVVWIGVLIVSLVVTCLLILKLLDKGISQPLRVLQQSLTRFTMLPTAYKKNSSRFEEVTNQVNQLIDTTRQQELDLLESKDKFASLYSALEESEEYYRALFEQANEAILLMQKPNLRFSHFNQTAHQLLGYDRKQFANLTISDIVSAAELKGSKINVSDDEIPSTFVAHMVKADGSDSVCRVHTADVSIQQKEYRMLMFHDISAQRSAQKELRELNSRLQTVLDASRHIAIIAVNKEGLIEIFNKGAETILKYDRSEMINQRHLIDVIHHCQIPVSSSNHDDPFSKMVSNVHSDSPLTSECIYKDSEDSEVPVEQTLTRIIDNEGNHHGFLCIAIDLRDKMAEQQRQDELESQLLHSQKMETIGTLAGGIAHDLNNLLTPVMGYTEMLLEDNRDNEKQERRLQRILNASLRAKELVKQILTFSHHVDHFSEPALIKSIVSEVLELIFASLPPQIQLTVDMKDPDARIFADINKIHQVLMNLCTNAMHAIGDKEGVITIEIDSIDYDESVGDLVLPSGKYAMIKVQDTGVGISDITRQRIFEPFFTTKDVGEGTGLGLSVVHGIVTSHNGTIRVQSELDKGSVFSVYLPFYEELEAQITTETTAPFGSGKRVMIVDDDEPVLQLSEELLKRKGYYVEAFSDSTKALHALRLVPDAFDVVITDQSMPELTGTELTREIRKFNEELPIILLTGLGNMFDLDDQSDLNIARVVSKPVLSNDLMQIIYEVTS